MRLLSLWNLALVVLNFGLFTMLQKVERATDRVSVSRIAGERSSSMRVQADEMVADTPAGSRTAKAQNVESLVAELKERLANAEERQIYALYLSGKIEPKFRRLLARLQLDEEKANGLLKLIVEKDLTSVEQYLQQPTEASPEQIARSVAINRLEYDAKIEALIGEPALKTYREYELTLHVRNAVDGLEQRLSYTSSPLSPELYDQAVAQLAANEHFNPQLVAPSSTQALLANKEIALNDATLPQMRGVLNAKQYAYYEQLVRQNTLTRRLARATLER